MAIVVAVLSVTNRVAVLCFVWERDVLLENYSWLA